MEEIDLKEMIKYFWKKKMLIIVAVIISTMIGVLYTKYGITPLYKSTTSLILVKTEFNTEADAIEYQKLINRFCVIANSKSVTNKVIDNLKLGISEEELRNKIEVENHLSYYALRINVSDTSPENAAKIADEIAKVVIEKINEIYKDVQIQILDVANLDYNPTNIDYTKNIIKCIAIGVILSGGYIVLTFLYKDIKKNNLEKESKENN